MFIKFFRTFVSNYIYSLFFLKNLNLKIIKTSDLFKNCEFLFLNLDENIANNLNQKRNIETAIVEHGGVKVQNFLSTTTHIIANKLDIRALNILKKNDIDIYKPKWVTDCIKYKKTMPKSPFYLTYACADTQKFFAQNVDCFGDSFYEDVNKETLKEIFENIKIDSQYLNHSNDDNNFNSSEIKKNLEILKCQEYQMHILELKQEFFDCEWLQKF